jgi:hypothetical protein
LSPFAICIHAGSVNLSEDLVDDHRELSGLFCGYNAGDFETKLPEASPSFEPVAYLRRKPHGSLYFAEK